MREIELRVRWEKSASIIRAGMDSQADPTRIKQPRSDIPYFRKWYGFSLIPGKLPAQFDTADLATALDQPRDVAQKVAYCLRHMNAIKETGKKGNTILYQLPTNPSRKRKRVA